MESGLWVEELLEKLQRKEEVIEDLRDEMLEQDGLVEELLEELELLEDERQRLNDRLEKALIENRDLRREVDRLQRKP